MSKINKKRLFVFFVWLIGMVAIFISMIGALGIRNYFPLGLAAILGWSYLINEAITRSEDLYNP